MNNKWRSIQCQGCDYPNTVLGGAEGQEISCEHCGEPVWVPGPKIMALKRQSIPEGEDTIFATAALTHDGMSASELYRVAHQLMDEDWNLNTTREGELTTKHSSSSHGLPVFILDGEAYGPKDLIEGLPFVLHILPWEWRGRAHKAGYEVAEYNPAAESQP